MNKSDALAAEIKDNRVVDFVREVERISRIERMELAVRLEDKLKKIDESILTLQTQIDELVGQVNAERSSDKYALTKAKLIRLMKDMGYYG
jgi:plasmid maintenance system antidote protein VapI